MYNVAAKEELLSRGLLPHEVFNFHSYTYRELAKVGCTNQHPHIATTTRMYVLAVPKSQAGADRHPYRGPHHG